MISVVWQQSDWGQSRRRVVTLPSELPARDQHRRSFRLTLGLGGGTTCPLAAAAVLTPKNPRCANVMPVVAHASLVGVTQFSTTRSSAARGAATSVFTSSTLSSTRG